MIIECAEFSARISDVVKAQELAATLEPAQPCYRFRKQCNLSLIICGSEGQSCLRRRSAAFGRIGVSTPEQQCGSGDRHGVALGEANAVGRHAL